MIKCTVLLRHQNSKTVEEIEVEADSVYHAAFLGISRCCKLWWFDPQGTLIVKAGERRWKVEQPRVMEWKKSRPDLQWKDYG